VSFLPDPGHDEDVVVLAEREQEDEEQEREQEGDAALPGEVDVDDGGQAEGGEVESTTLTIT
jgi:hypothetical protein